MAGTLIVVGGEALVDLVPGRDGTVVAHPGGGPFNTARAIARLGRPVAFLGRLSRDRFGEQIASVMADDGVRLELVASTEDPTTLAVAEVDDDGGARYRFYACGTAAPGLTGESAVSRLPADLGYLHVGTLGLALEPMAQALEAVVGHVAGRALVFVDPNCRPAVIDDHARYRERLDRVLALSDVVKLSEEDAAWLYPDEPPPTAVRRLLQRGPRLGVLTRGADGALVITPERSTAVRAYATAVVDTIGAGDVFGGSFLAWWQARGYGREELCDIDAAAAAARFASMAAALACSRPGATPPHLAEVERAVLAAGEPGLTDAGVREPSATTEGL